MWNLLHEERVRFLAFLAQTDFPTLLAWRLPAFTRRIFNPITQAAIANNGSLIDRKFAKQAARACFGYAVTGLSRLAPRQAWVGQGFARIGGSSSRSAIIGREHLHVEPDIGWFSRKCPVLTNTPLLAGDDGWDWLLRACHEAGLHRPMNWIIANRDFWQENAIGDFSTTLQQQDWLQSQWQKLGFDSLPGEGWWVTRLLSQEITLPVSSVQDLESSATPFFAEGTQPCVSPVPLVWRIALNNSEDVWCKAEEFWNWVVEQNTLQSPRKAASWTQVQHSALLVEFTAGQLRVLGFDPNPARSVSRASRLSSFTPTFTANFGSYPLKLSNSILDNRMIRPRDKEYLPTELTSSDDADVRTVLMTETIRELFTRELASPRYSHAPDLLPIYVNFRQGIRLPFGWLAADGNSLLLEARCLPELLVKVQHPLGLARLLQSWNPLFIKTTWLDVLINGKKSCVYTACGLGFDWLLTQLVNTVHQQSVFISIPSGQHMPSPITDAKGNELDACLLLRHFHSK